MPAICPTCQDSTTLIVIASLNSCYICKGRSEWSCNSWSCNKFFCTQCAENNHK